MKGHPGCSRYENGFPTFNTPMSPTQDLGNNGKTDDGKMVIGGIDSPGNSPYAITVGAVNSKQTVFRSDDVVATYSSRGPALYDWIMKPDVVAEKPTSSGSVASSSASRKARRRRMGSRSASALRSASGRYMRSSSDMECE